MNREDFRQWAHRAADWSADYLDGIAERPVRPRIEPGEIAAVTNRVFGTVAR